MAMGVVETYRSSPLCCSKAGIESKDCLNAYVQPWDPKGLEHNLCGHLSVLWRIQRGLCEYKVVVLTVYPEIVCNCLVPELFHMVPIGDLQQCFCFKQAAKTC